METPQRLLLPLAVLSVALLVATVFVAVRGPAPTSDDVPEPAVREPAADERATDERARGSTEPAAVLRRWDRARERAWADADVAALRALYVPGSATGALDVTRLRAWRSRGLRVEGVRPQLLELEVRRASESRIVLRVTERLARAVAVGHGVRRVLPASAAVTRTVTLRRSDRPAGRDWQVVRAVRTARPPARRARRGRGRRSPTRAAPAVGR